MSVQHQNNKLPRAVSSLTRFFSCGFVAVSLNVLAIYGCGSQSNSTKEDDTHSVHNVPTVENQSQKQIITDQNSTYPIGPIGILSSTNSEGEVLKCQIVNLGRRSGIAPTHCFGSTDPKNSFVTWVSSQGLPVKSFVTEIKVLPINNDEIESLSLVTLDRHEHEDDVIIAVRNFVTKGDQNPGMDLIIEYVDESSFKLASKKCIPRRFNTAGLLGYDCETYGNQSGALVRDESGGPIAIHLGRKGSIGYSALLSVFKSQVINAIEFKSLK